VANAKKHGRAGREPGGGGQADSRHAARERVAAMRAQHKRAERRRNLITAGAITAAVVIVGGGIAWYAASRSPGSPEVVPAAPTGAPQSQPAALVVPNTSGISGVVAYDTTGWPAASKNGPANRALGHDHVTVPVTYSVTPPVGGNHNPVWLNCGIYNTPVPSEYAVHDLEHGAVWITYQPSLPQAEVSQLRSFVGRQSVLTPGGAPGSRYMDLTPYPGLPAPVVVTAWGFQLRLTSPADPRLQRFVDKFRLSPRYAPEYPGECTGGTGTPAAS
jgi:hypothetical protein